MNLEHAQHTPIVPISLRGALWAPQLRVATQLLHGSPGAAGVLIVLLSRTRQHFIAPGFL